MLQDKIRTAIALTREQLAGELKEKMEDGAKAEIKKAVAKRAANKKDKAKNEKS